MSNLLLEVLVLLALIGLNGLFSMAEMAIVSSKKSRLEALAEGGNRRAKIVLDLLEHPESLFATVQLAITLIGVIAGVFGGATFAGYLATALIKFGLTTELSFSLSYGVIVVAITFLSIVFGELIPKRIAINNPESVACLVSPIIKILATLLSPINAFFTWFSNKILSLFGGLGAARPQVTEEELITMIGDSIEAGVVEHEERPILERVLTLGERRLDSIMTHRRDVAWIDSANTIQDNLAIITNSRHTWYPVCERSIDEVKGILCAKDLWSSNTPSSIKDYIKPAFFLPGSTMVLKAIEQFKETQNHIALIVDEYGNFEGLVTHHDLSSVILGSLPSRGEDLEEDKLVQREDGSWLISGALSVHDFSAEFDCSLTGESDEHDFQTVAGFVIKQLERIPKVGQHFEWNNFRFEVVDMDGNRVDKILLNRVQAAAEDVVS
jgi:putative hemolysin